MEHDISRILSNWKFDPDDICARKIVGQDGREKLQIRLDLGLLQMEVKGRPDGQCPHGCEAALDYYRGQLEAHTAEKGSDSGFSLGADACSELWQESLHFYHRYICLLRLGDHSGVLRDTEHNLAIFDLVQAYGVDEETRLSFEQYRPYVIMVNTRARGEIRLESDDYEGALRVVEQGIDRIRSFFDAFGDPELLESSEELQALTAWHDEIVHERPLNLQQRLSRELQEAIAEENYELAARLRDRLRRLETAGAK
jgi:hypothetical protein